MPIQFHNGKILFRSGKIAMDPRCCCRPGAGDVGDPCGVPEDCAKLPTAVVFDLSNLSACSDCHDYQSSDGELCADYGDGAAIPGHYAGSDSCAWQHDCIGYYSTWRGKIITGLALLLMRFEGGSCVWQVEVWCGGPLPIGQWDPLWVATLTRPYDPTDRYRGMLGLYTLVDTACGAVGTVEVS